MFCLERHFIFFSFACCLNKIPIATEVDQYANCFGLPNLSEFLELQKYSKPTDCYRLFYFLTDSIVFALCSYFDESMDFIGGYEP